jgi:hypothetical protein
LLRYYHHLDYEDITDVPALIARLKREEMNRSWVDIEDMNTKFEDLEALFASTREVTTNGAKYSGQFIDDCINGFGTWTESDGSKVIGEWEEGLFVGAL